MLKKLSISLLLVLAACGPGRTGNPDQQSGISVITSMGLLADLVKQVGGERVQVESLVPAGAGPEDYQATPGDSQKIAQAQIVFFNGSNLEAWIMPVFENAGKPDQPRINLSAGLASLDGNPHFWLDPTYAISYTLRIRDELIKLDPAGQATYQANTERYTTELRQLDAELAVQAQTIPAARRRLVTNHAAFPYFARRYGFEIVGVILENPEAELSAGDLATLVANVKASQVPAIFAESQFNQKTAQILAEEAGITTIAVLHTDALPTTGVASYVEMMRYNMQTIVKALKELDDTMTISEPIQAIPPLAGSAVAPALEVSHLSVAYAQREVVQDVSFSIKQGELVGIIGPNGAGKTSLLKAILQLIPATGSVLLDGKPLSRRSRRVAYVPQVSAVNWRFPATVCDVVVMGRFGQLGWLRRPGKRDRDLAMVALEQVNMVQLANQPIAELSGGQQQRVFLARALVQEPAVMLLDEPISGVDVPTQETILHLLQDLSNAGLALLITTHHLQHLEHHFDGLLCLNRRLIAYGPPAQIMTREVVEATFGHSLVLAPDPERIVLECGHDM